MRLRAGLLALVYLLGILNSQAAAQGAPDPIWREVGQVTYGDLHRRPPSAPLPAVDPAQVARWKAELGGAAVAGGKEGLWSAIKGGATGVIRNPVQLLKGGGRLIGQGAIFQIGVVGMNELLKFAFNELKTASDSAFGLCGHNALANGYDVEIGMPCEFVTTSTPVSFPHGPYPQTFNQTLTWWSYNIEGLGYYWNITNKESQWDINVACPAMPNNNPPKPGLRITGRWSTAQVEDIYSQYLEKCATPQVRSQAPVDLQTWVEGGNVNGQTIAPHPQVKDELLQAANKYFITVNPQPKSNGEVYPGMTLTPPPSASGWYGVPVSIYDDEDGDGWSDWEEILRESDPNDPQSVPDPTRDTDGDGVADGDEDRLGTDPYDPASKPDPEQLTDMDQDGITDDLDPDIDGDGVMNENDPAPKDKSIPVKCGTGMKPSTDGTQCVPETNPDGCPQGYKLDEAVTPPQCIPDPDAEKDPVGDQCGDFTVKRLMTHTGHYLRDVVFPCEPLDWSQLAQTVTTKFPFSVVSAMGNFFKGTDGSGTDSALPTKLGIFELDFDFAASFFLLIRTVWRAFLWWAFFTWLVGRLSGQVVLS